MEKSEIEVWVKEQVTEMQKLRKEAYESIIKKYNIQPVSRDEFYIHNFGMSFSEYLIYEYNKTKEDLDSNELDLSDEEKQVILSTFIPHLESEDKKVNEYYVFTPQQQEEFDSEKRTLREILDNKVEEFKKNL